MSRQRWQTILFVVVITAVIAAVLYIVPENQPVQGGVIVVAGAVVSVRAFEAESRRAMLSQLFLGPCVTATALATIVNIEVALLPAIAFGVLSLYYVVSDTIRKYALGTPTNSAGETPEPAVSNEQRD